MDLVIALVVGGTVGWTASLVVGTDHRRGVLANAVVGVVGSVLGTWLAGRIEVASGPTRWLLSLVGAALLIAIVRALDVRRARPMA